MGLPLSLRGSTDHTRRDMHCLQLLKPELDGIGNRLVFQPRLGTTRPTLIEMILLIDCRERATLYAHTRREGIADIHQALLREHGRTVRDEAVALHLTNTQTTITCPALARLTSERDNGTATA